MAKSVGKKLSHAHNGKNPLIEANPAPEISESEDIHIEEVAKIKLFSSPITVKMVEFLVLY